MGKRDKERNASKGAADGPAGLAAWLLRHERKLLASVVLSGLALRFANLREMQAHDPFFTLLAVDPKVYHEWAARIAGGDVLGQGVFFLSPLYAYFLGLVYAIFGSGFLVGPAVQALLGGGSIYLLFRIGRRLFDVRVGLLAAFCQAVYLPAIFYEGQLLVTAIQTPLNLLAVHLLLRAGDDPRRTRRWLAAGLVLGLSVLARPNVLLFAGFAALWIFGAFGRRLSRGDVLTALAAYGVGMAAALAPAAARNAVVGGDFVPVSAQGGVNFYIGNGPDATGTFVVPRIFDATAADDPIQQQETYAKHAESKLGRKLKPSEVSSFWYDATWAHIAKHPADWIHVLGRKLVLLVNDYELASSRDFATSRGCSAVLRLPLLTFGLVVPFALLGMLVARKRWEDLLPAYGMVLAYAVSLAIFFVLAHYRLPSAPFFILFAAHGIVWFAERLALRSARDYLPAAVGLAAGLLLAHLDIPEQAGSQFMIHFNLGNRYRLTGQQEPAVEEYRLSIDSNPTYISAHNNLALAYEMDRKTYGEAMETWRQVLAMARERGEDVYIERAKRHLDKLEEITKRRGAEPSRDGR